MPGASLSSIWNEWSWRPAILLGLAAVAASYAYGFYYFQQHDWLKRLTRRNLIRSRHPLLFALGLAAIFVALQSPIEFLDDKLFAAHMLQHILLMMVAPLLILLGLPSPMLRWVISELRLRKWIEVLTNPLLAFTLFNANLLLWHIPDLYQIALRNPIVHDVEHALFFYTALLFWWRVIDPTHGWYSLWHWAPAKWIYLLVAAPPSYVLGAILWANNKVLYLYYDQALRYFDLSALNDQRLAGMLMWLQGWMFVMFSMIVFFQWYKPETEQVG